MHTLTFNVTIHEWFQHQQHYLVDCSLLHQEKIRDADNVKLQWKEEQVNRTLFYMFIYPERNNNVIQKDENNVAVLWRQKICTVYKLFCIMVRDKHFKIESDKKFFGYLWAENKTTSQSSVEIMERISTITENFEF